MPDPVATRPARPRRPLRTLAVLLLAAPLAEPQEPAASRPELRSLAEERPSLVAAEDARLLTGPGGRAVGTMSPSDEGLAIRTIAGAVFEVPTYQRWFASADGRTVVGAGTPGVPEHPFELTVSVWRDGALVAQPDFLLDPESLFAIADDGRVALVGHAPTVRERWFALVLDAGGAELFRHALPRGEQARDAVFANDALVVRTHRLLDATGRNTVTRLDARGATPLFRGRALQQLVAVDARHVLVRGRDGLRLVTTSGEVRWHQPTAPRPVGPNAWALIDDANEPARIAVLHSRPRRAGQATPPVRLSTFDVETGAALDDVAVTRRPGIAAARLFADDGRLALELFDRKEVFGWTR